MQRNLVFWTTVLMSLSPAAALAEPGAAITACDAVANAKPLCIFQNPEDIAPLPGGQALLVGEYGAMDGTRAGAMVLLTLADEKKTTLFRGGDAKGKPTPGWGDATCPGPPPPGFSPHGIDVARRPDGKLQLLVVQHGGRESIEFFEVSGSGAAWQLAWRGCVLAPDDAWLNEVVAIDDGSFYTTNMMPRGGGLEDWNEMPSGPTGEAWAWSADSGFAKIPGTAGQMPNGIEASSDGKVVYLNLTMENAVRRIDRATGKLLGKASVPSPDNITWAPDGKHLLVASLRPEDPAAFALCNELKTGACPLEFAIVQLDAATMQASDLYESDGKTMGGGTVGLRVGDELFIGSFAGDRVLRVSLSVGDRVAP